MSTLWQMIGALVFAELAMTALFLVQRKTQNAGIVDAGWSYGIGILAIAFAAMGQGDWARRVAAGGLAAVWGFRLGTYVLLHRVIGQPEEGRYQTIRETWPTVAVFAFFLLQGLLSFLFALPVLVACANPAAWGWTDILAVLVWVASVGGEGLADKQLTAFKRDPSNAGQVCRTGLWRYSRHPNYFFEWIHWWAYVLFSLGHSLWWTTLAAPALMLFFLMKITGIPPTEAQALRSRGEAYRKYQRTTSVFFPWFPKKTEEES